jgi:K+-transporting ATPase KdpF subunit
MKTIILIVTSGSFEMNDQAGYALGALIALSILGYLVYALVKPEKF